MIIIIDAYNMLKQIITDRDISESERVRFISQMSAYVRRKKHKLIVVFDAGPYEWVYTEKVQGVRVVYSGAQSSADDYIKQYLNEHAGKDILLVSDDRELNVCAARLGLPSIAPRDFYRFVREALEKKHDTVIHDGERAVKIAQEESPEIDALMQQASKMVTVKNEDLIGQAQNSISNGRRLSKIDRALLKKLKKL